MDLPPAYGPAVAIGCLRTLLSQNAWFQDWCGHHLDVTGSLDHLVIGPVEANAEPDGNFVVIRNVDAVLRDVDLAVATALPQGELELIIVHNCTVAYQNDARNAEQEKINAVGGWLQALRDVNAQTVGSYRFYTHNRRWVEEAAWIPFSAHKDNSKRWERWEATMRLGWGVEG